MSWDLLNENGGGSNEDTPASAWSHEVTLPVSLGVSPPLRVAVAASRARPNQVTPDEVSHLVVPFDGRFEKLDRSLYLVRSTVNVNAIVSSNTKRGCTPPGLLDR
jgi:hypothetical protein